MKLNAARVAEFRQALARVEPSAFGLADVELFPGATSRCRRSTIVCTFDTATQDRLEQAAAEAARLIEDKFGLPLAHGVAIEPGGKSALWLEYFPGGARYESAYYALHALRAGFASQAAETKLAAAELARFDEIPIRDIFHSLFVIRAARKADLPIDTVAGSSAAWQFGWGARSDIFFGTGSLADSVPGHQISWRKHYAKQFFREIGIPTPKWRTLPPDGDAMAAAAEIGWPCAVKPINRAFGMGVTANISSPQELRVAVTKARRLSSQIMIEAHEPGDDHRLMVVDGRLIAAIRRVPPSVTGDGRRTLEQLIADFNSARDEARATRFLERFEPDAALVARLAVDGLTMDSVLPKGALLQLSSVANVSAGGVPIDVTDQVHPQVRGMAELLANSLGLRTAGVDYMTTDISRSHAEVGGGFIEVNAMPHLRVLVSGGREELEVGVAVLGARPGRIPVRLIIGDSAALALLAAPVQERTAAAPGRAAVSSSWARIGAIDLPMPGLDPFAAVAATLRHLSVEEAVILWTPAQMAEFGLPADSLEKAVVIGDEPQCSSLAEICSDVVRVADAGGALEAAFA